MLKQKDIDIRVSTEPLNELEDGETFQYISLLMGKYCSRIFKS